MATASKKSAKKAVKKAVKKPVAKKAAAVNKPTLSLAAARREAEQKRKEAEAAEVRVTNLLKATVDDTVQGIVATLKENFEYLSRANRNAIMRALEPVGAVQKPGKSTSNKKAKAKAGGGASFTPKYSLPNGDEWAGRGQIKASYAAWEKTPEGKKWRKEHPIRDGKKDWPLNPAWVKEQDAK